MGYRSQVRCLIYGPPDKLDAFIIEHQLILNTPVFQQFKENLSKYSAKIQCFADGKAVEQLVHVLDLNGDRWKWYDDYPDVQAWVAFQADAEDADLEVEFIRVGEENADVEEHSTEGSGMLLSTTRPQIVDDFDKVEDLTL